MDKYLRPNRFDCDPNAAGADKQFKHWLQTFQNFIATIRPQTVAPVTSTDGATTGEGATAQAGGVGSVQDPTGVDQQQELLKLRTLTNYVAANVFEYIADCSTYAHAIETLTKIYIKPVNEIYARYKLQTYQQAEGESLDTFIQTLHRLSKDCNFKAVSAEDHRQGYVRDAFISGIRSREIRQKLLENTALNMEEVFSQARTLQTAHTNAAGYRPNENSFTSCATSVETNPPDANCETQFSQGEIYNQNYVAAATGGKQATYQDQRRRQDHESQPCLQFLWISSSPNTESMSSKETQMQSVWENWPLGARVQIE